MHNSSGNINAPFHAARKGGYQSVRFVVHLNGREGCRNRFTLTVKSRMDNIGGISFILRMKIGRQLLHIA